jgi:hypothetical protein
LQKGTYFTPMHYHFINQKLYTNAVDSFTK